DDDPKRGVVDRDCRVHGMANLFVAGSSVFPTAGAAPPTLTIVALALRLADHLRRVMGLAAPTRREAALPVREDSAKEPALVSRNRDLAWSRNPRPLEH